MHSGPRRTRPDPRHLAGEGRPAPASGRSTAPPRHRAPTAGHRRHLEPLLVRRSRRAPLDAGSAPASRERPVALDPADLDAADQGAAEQGAAEQGAPVAVVPRRRLAFAVAITLAAVPVLVVDNISATAETNDGGAPVERSAATADPAAWTPSSTVTTAAPTTTSTTAAPTTTTVAPPTTEAPAVRESSVAAQAPVTTAPPTTAPPPPPTTAPRAYGDPNDPVTWERMAQCESGGRWAMNSGNGYYGGLQFSLATWRGVGGAGYPHQASKAEQIKRGQILQARAGWGQWPHCARQLGYL